MWLKTTQVEKLNIIFKHILNDKPQSIERISGGRNSRVFRIEGSSGRIYAAKVYFQTDFLNRDRNGTEYNTLKYLWKNNLSNIPKPIYSDDANGICIYEFIHGKLLKPEEIKEEDIDQAIDFLVALEKLKNRTDARLFQPASEAFFNITDIIANIEQRFNRLTSIAKNDILASDLFKFIKECIQPELVRMRQLTDLRFKAAHLTLDKPLPISERTLSPSDFGFHNALQGEDGRLVFLDFEYFGWDDPAKLIVDFLIHPQMNLSRSLQKYFLKGMLRHFTHIDRLPERIPLMYYLFGIKWCLILLNEFVPDDKARRDFAAMEKKDVYTVRFLQLEKSMRLFSKIKRSDELDFGIA